MTQLIEHLISFGFGLGVGAGLGLLLGVLFANLSQSEHCNCRPKHEQ